MGASTGLVLSVLLGSVVMASPAIAADDPALMPPGYVGGGASSVAPPAPSAPTPPSGPTCTVPHPVQGCDTPDVPYIPLVPDYVPPAPAPAPVNVLAPAAPAEQPHAALAPVPAPGAYAPNVVAPVQAPAPAIQNPLPDDGEVSLSIIPAEELAVGVVAVEAQRSGEATSSNPSISATPSPPFTPKSDAVIKAGTTSVADNDGFDAVPIVILAGLGALVFGGFVSYQKLRCKRI
ncbi:hypothetical protein FBY36_0248 [Arthrobacter sp. SLBN-122]|nr:hypothetical protein FBY36_0248 [Arthrobacter sp. SLBN-122]